MLSDAEFVYSPEWCDPVRTTLLPEEEGVDCMIVTARLSDRAIAIDERLGLNQEFGMDPTKPFETVVLRVSKSGAEPVAHFRHATIEEARSQHAALVHARETQ